MNGSVLIPASIWGESMIRTDPWVGATPSLAWSLLRSTVGNLQISILLVDDDYCLHFKDDVNNVYIALPLTDDQIAGTDWSFIKIRRVGDQLFVTCDKVDLDPVTISVVDYGGSLVVGERCEKNLFDVRVVPAEISKAASDYYIDDVTENGGGSTMPQGAAVVEAEDEESEEPEAVPTFTPTGASLVKTTTGDLRVNIEYTDGVPYLIFQDGLNDLAVELPFTEDQISGIDWATVKLRRQSGDLIISVGKTELAPIAIEYRKYGGSLIAGAGSEKNMHDLRVVPAAISQAATNYYIDDIVQNAGRAVMP